MSTVVRSLHYSNTPLEAYQQELALPHSFALVGGRYTILGWDPMELVTEFDEHTFDYMTERMAGISTEITPCGGWYGYLGYELAERLHGHLEARVRDLPFPDLCMGLYDRVIVFDHVEKKAYEVCHKIATPRARAHSTPYSTSFAPACGDFSTNLPPLAYQAAFEQAQAALRRGDCYQVNLAQRFSAEFTGNPWDYFLSLLQSNPAPFGAYLNLPEGAVISCSPERFIRIEKGLIETKPIKGTAPRHENPILDREAAAQLSLSEKNRAENLMIVDLMRNDLGKICEPGSIQVPSLFEIESYRSVHHLVSTVTGKLKPEISPLNALKACFPGGSITGAPKLAAMQLIRALEPHARHLYCGSIGYCDFSGTLDMNIAIRTALLTQGRCHLWAGGGIVLDSTWEAEYQECLDKIRPFMQKG